MQRFWRRADRKECAAAGNIKVCCTDRIQFFLRLLDKKCFLKFVMNEQDLITHIGKRLRLRRTMLGLSQEDVGNGIGVASQQVQKYEKGTNVVNAVRLYEFSQYLKVPVAYFFDGVEESAPEKKKAKAVFAGLAEESVEFEGEYKATSDRETLEVIKSFKRIKDHALRKRVADLLRALSLKDI